ncbi:hypothetical protein I6I76_09585 [Dermacoccus nishinomiyaensis]|uniref:hypothetical protein n=1 Tax=Dermacoccus nishinomiyaensis TaxID=1274 RepID=UPI000E07B461|nr:hypothetical protein [Dermacoccus nishinomiyaensis]QQY23786.1 hypothetical protein I6I76_09585 [Dermacoccus nishinomiyaensis]STD13224.1 Uncharacterised protein [Dermacoccus nishinomiyaensis]
MNTLSLAFESAWKVLLIAIVLGAGVPALFAFGVRGCAAGEGALTTGESAKSWCKPVGLLCFALVAVAVALGLAIIIASGFGYKVSFEHVFPTFAEKK